MSEVDTGQHLPRHPDTGLELPPQDQPGYYQGFSTLAQQEFWDAKTREVVLQRVETTPPITFFDAETAAFWTIVFDHLLPQSDRTAARRIPIVNVVDHRLDIDRTVGYRFSDMPPDREAYGLGRRAIDEEARESFDAAFVDLSYGEREAVLKRIHAGEPRAAEAIWERMSVHRFWQLIITDAIEAYYAHPWSWDEIGFGGPAYPRGYMRLERGDAEPWEMHERRYAWSPPPASLSGETQSTTEFHIESEQHRSNAKRARAT